VANFSLNSGVVSIVGRWHQSLVFGRRVRVLSEALAAEIPGNSSVLDIGCGDGSIASLIQSVVPGVQMQGIETSERPACRIPCHSFDGIRIPFPDAAFDICMFVDVLHHTNSIREILAEAARVSRRFILVKDHLCESALDFRTLQFMDWVGNRAHGVVLPYNYQSKAQWLTLFGDCGLKARSWNGALRLYPAPFNAVFGRNLHFSALLEKAAE
jgi:SAM-dependent methyltransferase